MGLDDRWMAARRLAQTLTEEQRHLLLLLAREPDWNALSDEIVGQARLEQTPNPLPDRELLRIAQVDYALGRWTTASFSVALGLREDWTKLSPATRSAIVDRIMKAIDDGTAGMDLDVRHWRSVLAMAEAHDTEHADTAT